MTGPCYLEPSHVWPGDQDLVKRWNVFTNFYIPSCSQKPMVKLHEFSFFRFSIKSMPKCVFSHFQRGVVPSWHRLILSSAELQELQFHNFAMFQAIINRLFCCTSRDEKTQESEFDKEILTGFTRVAKDGLLQSHPSSMLRRQVDGTLGLSLHYSPEHFKAKRKPEWAKEVKVVRQPDPAAFNFTKIKDGEVITHLEVAGRSISAVVCASPLLVAHTLFVPDLSQCLPQQLTTDLILCGLELLKESARPDFRVLFNSLLAHASVNHFHFHGMFLNFAGLKRFPVEAAKRSFVGGDCSEGNVCAEILVETDWYSRALILTAGAGVSGVSDLDALSMFAGKIIAFLQEKDIPHNVMLVPPGERRRPFQSTDPFETEELPAAASPEVWIFPRQSEHKVREDPGINTAICETSGLLFAHDEQRFKTLDETHISEIFTQDVSLPGGDFDNLICKVAWMLSSTRRLTPRQL